jgi:hypothetical protein
MNALTPISGEYTRTCNATIIDRPCGSGKSTEIIGSFKTDQRYLVVVPTLDEINQRYLPETDRLYGKGFFKAPSIDEKSTKYEHIEELLVEGQNVITTHALYMDIVMLAKKGLLKDYNIIIDEVLQVVSQFTAGPKRKTWKEIYLDKYAELDSNNRVLIKQEWEDNVEDMDDALSVKTYKAARAGCLYLVNGAFWIWALPKELFNLCKSMTVYTYKADGSLMLPYLNKVGLPVHHVTDPVLEVAWKQRCREKVIVQGIPSLANIKLTDSKQDKISLGSSEAKRISTALSTLRRRQLKGVPLENILITCKKGKWYQNAKGPKEIDRPRSGSMSSRSDLFRGTNWIANTTRGTNNYKHCTDLIYLYDQYPAPALVQWLEMEEGYHDVAARYALTELIQWLFRSAIRDDEPVTLYMPSARMRKIFDDWRYG